MRYSELTENFQKIDGGWLHTGTGHKRDPESGEYPIYPLPRWTTFTSHARNREGTWEDIFHYMRFAVGNHQTLYDDDLTGSEIANVLTGLYNTNKDAEMAKFNADMKTDVPDWQTLFVRIKRNRADELMQALMR